MSWSGQDDAGGSGIATYDVFVSDNGGAVHALASRHHAYLGRPTPASGHTYAFYSVATDNVGHVEDRPRRPDAMTQVIETSATTTTSLQSSNDSPTYGNSLVFTATVAADSPDSGTPTGTVQFLIDGANFGAAAALVDGVATSEPIASLGAGRTWSRPCTRRTATSPAARRTP